jgi:predicted HTH domain antitoxin
MVTVQIDDKLAEVIQATDEPVDRVASELMIMELFRRGTISGGKAAELLGMDRLAFIRHAADLGIPYFHYSVEDWEAEVARIRDRTS